MTGSTHVAIAVSATIGLSMTTGYSPDTAGWVAVVIGSLAPDIDSGGGTICRPGSLLGRILPKFLRLILDAIGLLIGSAVRKVFGHRNAIHWPIIGVILAFIGLNTGLDWLVWFGLGYVWHILGDFLTKSGVPILGPFWTKDIKWSPIRTGGFGEFAVALPCWGFIIWQGWAYIPAEARYWVERFAYKLIYQFL